MPNYNDAQGVADLLSQFDFNIISEGPGDFSTQHRKYTCEFSKPGIESFTTTYQSNPDVHGQRPVTATRRSPTSNPSTGRHGATRSRESSPGIRKRIASRFPIFSPTHQPQSGSALIKASPATCSAPPWRRRGPSTRR